MSTETSEDVGGTVAPCLLAHPPTWGALAECKQKKSLALSAHPLIFFCANMHGYSYTHCVSAALPVY